MTLEVISILIYALLLFGTLTIQAGYAGLTAGLTYGFSNRETDQPGKGAAGHRIDKTLGNLKEGAVIYLPLALLAVNLDVSNGWTQSAAVMTIFSRALYVPIYMLGIKTIRTIIWTPSFLAIPVMAIGIVAGL